MNSHSFYTYVLKFSFFFWVCFQKSKMPSDGTCLGEPPVRFLWCWLLSLFCCCLSFVIFLHSHFLFDIIPHSSVDYRQVFTHILYFQPSPSQSGSWHFYFQPFYYLLNASAMVLSGHFLPYDTSQHFWHNLLLSKLAWEPVVVP